MKTMLNSTLNLRLAVVLIAMLILPLASLGQSLDPQVIAQGRALFQADCTQCHEASRSLQKRKSRGDWLATVRRMASLDEANIAESHKIPIATYLASLSEPARASNGRRFPPVPSPNGGFGDTVLDQEAAPEITDAIRGDEVNSDDKQMLSADDLQYDSLSELDAGNGSGLSASATISPMWRNGNDNLENPNFFVDAWFRADWQPNGPLRARATACTSCHSDRSGGAGFTIEMVEAYASYDLLKKHHRCTNPDPDCRPQWDAEIKAGRFVVPFGAFSSMVHPGSDGTVTAPLAFNMGRQVHPIKGRPPVLPMPYSDEGVDLKTGVQYRDFVASLDIYGVNGLQGFGPGVQFTPSRSYTDNNSDVAFGSRATIGCRSFRVGGSVMSGRMQDEGSTNLKYHVAGADVTGRFCDNLLRFYFEYAIRRNDTSFGVRQIAYGTVTQLDGVLLEDPNVRVVVRYDTLEHRDFAGSEGIRRFTWGLSATVFGGSRLMINHEHWRLASLDRETDVLGLRWITVF